MVPVPGGAVPLLGDWVSVVLAETLETTKRAGADLLGGHRAELDEHNVTDAEAAMELGAVEYRRTDVVWAEIYDAFRSSFEEYDLLLPPTLVVPPFEHGKCGPENIECKRVDPILKWTLT